MKVIWAISADGIVGFWPLCTGSCSNTYAEHVSCIMSRLDRNLLIHISLLEIVGCVMLTIIWSLPLFGWFFTCQRSFLPKLKNKPQTMRSILSSSDFVLQQCTVKKKLFPVYLSESTGFERLSICACFYGQRRTILFVCHPGEMLLAPWS